MTDKRSVLISRGSSCLGAAYSAPALKGIEGSLLGLQLVKVWTAAGRSTTCGAAR